MDQWRMEMHFYKPMNLTQEYDASGKAPRYSVREVGGLMLSKESSECPKPISPPHPR